MGTWVLDLDGVVWRGDHLLPGAVDAVDALVARGHRVVFCTNHAMSATSKRQQLDRAGVGPGDVVTSGEVAAASCDVGERIMVLGDPTLVATFRSHGHHVVDVDELADDRPCPECDVVVVGATARWDRSRVGLAADGVRNGARLVATNDDPTFPVWSAAGPRVLPGNGALVAAVATAAGAVARVVGKPHEAMVDFLRRHHGDVDVVVGDKAETDGGLAAALGARFGLVLCGVTSADDLPVEPTPDVVAEDLLTLVDLVHR